MVEGLGSAVLPQPYQQQAMPTPRSGAVRASARARCQWGRSASRQSPMPTAWRVWPVAVVSPSRSAFRARNSRRSRPAASARRSISASPAMAACGTPKPRKAPETGPWVWMARARARTCGHAVGAGGVDGDAVGDGGAPAGIGAGVEDAFELERGEPARRVAAEPGGDARGVALGGGDHGLAAGVGHPHRPAGLERGEAEQRLQRDVELAAEAAADGGGDDPHALGRQRQERGGVVAVHERGLGAGADHQRVAVEPGGAGLGLDIGVLDEAGAEGALDHDARPGPARRRRRRGAPGPRSAGCAGGRHGAPARRAPRRPRGRLSPAAATRRRGSRRAPGRGGTVLEGDERHRLAAEARRRLRPAPAGRRSGRSRRSGSGRGCRRR